MLYKYSLQLISRLEMCDEPEESYASAEQVKQCIYIQELHVSDVLAHIWFYSAA